MPIISDLKRMGEVGAGFLGTDAVAGYITSRLIQVTSPAAGQVSVVGKSKYAQIGSGLLGAAYLLLGLYTAGKLPSVEPDIHYLLSGATAGLVTNAIYNIVAAAVMNKTLTGMAGEAVKALAGASMAIW